MSDPMDSAGSPGPDGDRRCTGTSKQTGERCKQRPTPGATVCRFHGGWAPQTVAAAERRTQEAVALAAVATFGLRRDVSAEDALLEELQWTAGHVAWLRDRVAELEPDALVWGRTEEVDRGGQFPGVDITEAAQPNIWLTLYQSERKHLLAVGAAVIKAGVEERRVRLAEAQGAKVVEVIQRAFNVMLGRLIALGLGPALVDQWPALMREVVVVELRALASGEAA